MRGTKRDEGRHVETTYPNKINIGPVRREPKLPRFVIEEGAFWLNSDFAEHSDTGVKDAALWQRNDGFLARGHGKESL
jgi:hypothetical protein